MERNRKKHKFHSIVWIFTDGMERSGMKHNGMEWSLVKGLFVTKRYSMTCEGYIKLRSQ
jgi:hypothetical protein